VAHLYNEVIKLQALFVVKAPSKAYIQQYLTKAIILGPYRWLDLSFKMILWILY